MNLEVMTSEELMSVDGGTGLEIMIGSTVIAGAPAWGLVGLGVVALGGIAALGFYVASQN